MKRTLTLLLTCLLTLATRAVVADGEYYIVNDFYEKALTTNSDGDPRLSAYDSANDEAFLFIAEASGTEGYVTLRHKSTGQYLTASTSNTWSVLLSDEGEGDAYLWALDTQFSTAIVSKKNTSARLGCDFSSGSTYYTGSTYIPVYYNKGKGALNWFSVVRSNGEGYTSSLAEAETESFTNEYGIREQDAYQVASPISLSGVDYHIISATPFGSNGSVNIEDSSAWLIFENVRPATVISSYLGNVTIGGEAAKSGSNCRVEIYLRGAAVIPLTSEAAFVATTDEGTFSVGVGSMVNLESEANKARSFTLKRGYMATVATDADGGGYSRVYVADHADLTVSLPTPLDRRISSVYVRKWHYVPKSGYAGSDTGAAATAGGTWWWNWDANSSSTTNLEYIPIKQHLYWPSDGNFYNNTYTAMMMFNEPNHSEQHSSSTCTCGGTISSWTAYTNTGKFNATGLRIGSPAETTISYIKEYLTYCDNMKQRCDFACVHGYWTSEWSSDLYTLIGYGRPVWITEWKYGASWTTSYTPSGVNEYAEKVLNILDVLEYNENIERYSYYGVDTGGTNGWMTALFWDCNYLKGTTPTGYVYKKVKPHLGYVAENQPVPNWWAPTMSAPVIEDCTLPDGAYRLSVTNSYADNSASLTAYMLSGEDWTEVGSVTDRSAFDSSSVEIELSAAVKAGSTLKLVLASLYSSTTVESDTYTIPLYCNVDDLQNLTFDEGSFVSQNVLTYAKDITNSDTQTSGMQDVDGWTLGVTNGDARASGQYAWGSDCYLGSADYLAPTCGSDGATEGGGLGIVSVWTAQTQYVQYVTLPRGEYTLTIPIYNAGGTTAMSKNLIGFVEDDGTEHFLSATTYAVGEWTTETLSFTLTNETKGYLSLGYTAVNKGSSAMPHLFIDYVSLDHYDALLAPTATEAPTSQAYTLDGRQAGKATRGIVLKGGRKVVVK